MQETRYVQHNITSGYISIVVNNYTIPAFWAHPDAGRGTFPGLVMLHGARGLTAQIRMFARHYAEVGFYVVAPDLFGGNAPHSAEAVYQQIHEFGPLHTDSALSVLKTYHRCNRQMGIVGWQVGGELAYHAALHRNDLRAAVIFCARPDDYIALMPDDTTDLIAFYGDSDPEIPPGTLYRVSEAMSRSGAKWQLIVYPDVTSEFIDETAPGYHPYYATDARYKALDFLADRFELPLRGVERKRIERY